MSRNIFEAVLRDDANRVIPTEATGAFPCEVWRVAAGVPMTVVAVEEAPP